MKDGGERRFQRRYGCP